MDGFWPQNYGSMKRERSRETLIQRGVKRKKKKKKARERARDGNVSNKPSRKLGLTGELKVLGRKRPKRVKESRYIAHTA